MIGYCGQCWKSCDGAITLERNSDAAKDADPNTKRTKNSDIKILQKCTKTCFQSGAYKCLIIKSI